MDYNLNFEGYAILGIIVHKKKNEHKSTPIIRIEFATSNASSEEKNQVNESMFKKTEDEKHAQGAHSSFQQLGDEWVHILNDKSCETIFLSGIEKTLKQCLRDDKIIADAPENNFLVKPVETIVLDLSKNNMMEQIEEQSKELTKNLKPIKMIEDEEIITCLIENIFKYEPFQELLDIPNGFFRIYKMILSFVSGYPYLGERRLLMSHKGKPIYESGPPRNERWN